MPSNFSTRLLLVIIAVLFSCVIALTGAFIVYASAGSLFAALSTGAAVFATTMTLSVVVLALLLQ